MPKNVPQKFAIRAIFFNFVNRILNFRYGSMKQSDEYVLLIEKKVQELIRLHEHLASDNEDLIRKNDELNQIIKTQSDKIQELEKRVINLKLAKHLTNNKEAAKAKKKINEMLREIDKCVGLLSK